jgi:hypothetical protein
LLDFLRKLCSDDPKRRPQFLITYFFFDLLINGPILNQCHPAEGFPMLSECAITNLAAYRPYYKCIESAMSRLNLCASCPAFYLFRSSKFRYGYRSSARLWGAPRSLLATGGSQTVPHLGFPAPSLRCFPLPHSDIPFPSESQSGSLSQAWVVLSDRFTSSHTKQRVVSKDCNRVFCLQSRRQDGCRSSDACHLRVRPYLTSCKFLFELDCIWHEAPGIGV